MKFVRVDMSAITVQGQTVPEVYQEIGGRALTSSCINDCVPATCEPLGLDNVLIFAPGYFSGTPLVNTSRLFVGAKSPLTGGIKESNVWKRPLTFEDNGPKDYRQTWVTSTIAGLLVTLSLTPHPDLRGHEPEPESHD